MYPAFLGIGAQKAGTSWLHTMLSTHEDIWLPHVKELHYFDRKFPIRSEASPPNGRSRRSVVVNHVSARLRRFSIAKVKERLSFRRWRDLTWEFQYLFGSWDDDWYANLFESAQSRLAGEVTPAYSCLSEKAIAHIYTLMPKAKLILLLRDPIERAWSHAKMDLARATRRRTYTVSQAEYIQHFNSFSSMLRGDYLGTMRRWLTFFPKDQLFVGYYDEILNCPDQLLLSVFRFLDVSATSSNVPSQIRIRVNPGGEATIPIALRQHLATLYVDDLKILARDLGSYPRQWLERCETALSTRQE